MQRVCPLLAKADAELPGASVDQATEACFRSRFFMCQAAVPLRPRGEAAPARRDAYDAGCRPACSARRTGIGLYVARKYRRGRRQRHAMGDPVAAPEVLEVAGLVRDPEQVQELCGRRRDE